MLLLVAAVSSAQMPPFMGGGQGGQMPDPRMMSGTPLPVSDLPVGTVSIRVIRGSMTNALPGQTVELTGAGAPQTIKTDDTGHATFSGLTPGAHVKATATVDGQKIESQDFDVPAQGGVRMVLFVADADADKKAAEEKALANSAPIKGIVVIGDQSRFVLEMGDDGLNVFDILQIVNTARRPVQTDAPLVFDLPKDAKTPGMVDGSAPNAVLANNRVTVTGPFPPGTTNVQFAYTLPIDSGTLTITQRMPAQMPQFTLLAQKIGNVMTVSSPQIAQQREMAADGQNYIVAEGPAVRAGDTVSIVLNGLPHPAAWPRTLALALAGVILALGAWKAVRPGRPARESAARERLEATRERLLGELAALEQQHRDGTIDPVRHEARSRELMTSLETVYARLDEQAAA